MQLTQETVALYQEKSPELMDAVVQGAEADYVMKRDPVTDYCVKFDAGWCGIHRDYGADFLGDACHFYPRITRGVGQTTLTTASLSCPETARLMLLEADAFATAPRTESRVPFSLKQYLPDGMDEAAALALHQLCLTEAAHADYSPEENFLRVQAVGEALALQPIHQWPEAAAFYFKIAAGRLPAIEPVATDPFHLLQALHGLVGASKASARPRLMRTIARMEQALGVQLEATGMQLAPDAAERYLRLVHHYKQHAAIALSLPLKRYLQAQLSMAFFPFAGLGETLSERLTIIGVRFATTKLALMAAALQSGGVPGEDVVVETVQSLSRFLDHLAEPALSLQIYHEVGWMRPPRLRAVLME